MATEHKVDICVVGAGSGGLSVAAAAAQFGVSVALVEKGRMGGDCLNYGCVPSKALIAAGRHAHAMGSGAAFGVAPQPAEVDFAKVNSHVHDVIASIAPNDSVERFTGLGVTVIEAAGSFKDGRTVVAGDHEITARRFVIATGSSPAVPSVEGLDDVAYLTNETIFENDKLPRHLIVIGGGPIGMELAQAHCRLGSRVTVLERFEPLARDDPELTRVVLDSVESDGVDIRAGVKVNRIAKARHGVRVEIEGDGGAERIEGSHLLIAAGRKANVEGLNLEAAGVEYSARGIMVDSGLRTANRRIYAIGDVAGGLQFTHVAGYHAGLVIRNALFRLPVRVNHDAVPWVTYTDPELAHVGLGEDAARERHGTIRVLRWPFAENDRAQAERRTRGLVKVVTTAKGRILSASIVGYNADELIQPWILAVTSGMKIKDMTGFVAPYPTLGEVSKRVAYGYYTPRLASPWIRRAIGLLSKLG